jgi:hypothetical protein
MTNLEQVVINRFRNLSAEKQEDVLQFLDLIQQDLSDKPTLIEVTQAREILDGARQRALANPQKPASQLWDNFNQMKDTIAEEYERHSEISGN